MSEGGDGYDENFAREGAGQERDRDGERERERERDGPWTGELSAVVGLQKRGLRGLMEGRRMRERGRSLGARASASAGMGVGVGVNGHGAGGGGMETEGTREGMRTGLGIA